MKKRSATAVTKIGYSRKYSAASGGKLGSTYDDLRSPTTRPTRKQLMNRSFEQVLEFEKNNPELYREIMKG